MKKFSQVLVIDDDQISNFITKGVVEDMDLGDDVIEISSAAAAIDHLRDCCLDSDTNTILSLLVFLDLNMPGMSGFDFLDEYQRLNIQGDIKVVLLTSSDYASDMEKARKYNDVMGYLSKPITKEKISDILLLQN